MKRKSSYYIEIRYFGRAKHEIKRITSEVYDKFGLKSERKSVPHITLIQPFNTNKEKYLISDFKRICAKYDSMKFIVDGVGVFPFFVVFFKVKPDDKLLRFRHHLLNKLKSYCYIKNINRTYKPHTTVALRMGFFKFFRIWFYLLKKPRIVFTNQVMRVTLLKDSKILYEYDFITRKLLNRNQALKRSELSKTFRGLKNNKRSN